MRVVVDTNVVISRYMSPTSAPAAVLLLWERNMFELVVSPVVLAEYDRVLREPDIRRYHRKSDAELAAIIQRFRGAAIQVEPSHPLAIIKDDPDDDRLLECAVAGKADYIVSGDKHLLVLGSYQ